jgi:hypothetical protein
MKVGMKMHMESTMATAVAATIQAEEPENAEAAVDRTPMGKRETTSSFLRWDWQWWLL